MQMVSAMTLHRTLLERAHFEQLATIDPVTQVTNHRYFQEHLRKTLDGKPKSAALMMIDVDHFKSYNDRFGHPEGDRLLFLVAQSLAKLVGDAGVVSRYGGEEFTIILPDCGQKKAAALGEQIRDFFAETSFANQALNSSSKITVSLGLALYPKHGALAQELIEQADRALYQAKRQGRNRLAVAT